CPSTLSCCGYCRSPGLRLVPSPATRTASVDWPDRWLSNVVPAGRMDRRLVGGTRPRPSLSHVPDGDDVRAHGHFRVRRDMARLLRSTCGRAEYGTPHRTLSVPSARYFQAHGCRQHHPYTLEDHRQESLIPYH